MRQLFLTTVALSAMGLAAPALAADLPARTYTKAPPMLSPAFNWSGFYVGVHAGYGFDADSDITTTGQAAINVLNVSGGARPGTVRLDRDGFVGGGQIGYNWQPGTNWVFGIEADISYTDFDRSRSVVTVPLSGVGTLNNTFSSQMEYFGTARGRIGYAWDRTMLYATGGFAYGRVENSATFFGGVGQAQFVGGARRTETGYTVGGGIEHALSDNLSVKAEYLYYDLGSTDLNVAVIPLGPPLQGGGTGYNTRFENDGHIVRAGLNYKFGGPVVARY